MQRSLRGLLLILVGLMLFSGCATQQTRVNQKRLHDAALINAQLGIDYMRSGNLKRAHAKLKLAMSQNPDSSRVRSAYALLMQRLGENSKAENNFRKALELDPSSADVHNNFGAFLCGQKRYAEAQKQFKDALSNPLYSTPQYAYANSGLCYLNQGDEAKAMKAFDKTLKLAPNFIPVLYQLAKLSANKGNWKKADTYLREVQGSSHYSPAILALCMKVKQHLGDMNGAALCARDLYRMFPNSPEAKALLNGGG